MIRKLKSRMLKLLRLKEVKNFCYLTASQLILKILYFFAGTYILYLLGLENYGYYSTVLAFTWFFNCFYLSGMNKVIFRLGIKSKTKLTRNINGSILFYVLESFTLIGVVIVTTLFLNNYTYILKVMICLFSINILFNILKGLFVNVILSFEKMQYIGIIAVLERGVFLTVAILCLKLGLGWKSVTVIALCSNLMTCCFFFCIARKLIPVKLQWKIKIPVKTIKQALIFTLITLGITLSTKIDVFMISILGTPAETGAYNFVEKLVFQFESFRGIIAIVTFPFFVKKYEKIEDFPAGKYLKYILVLLFILIIVFYTMGKVMSFIIIYFIGERFILSAEILQVLLLYLSFIFAMIPLSNAMQAAYLEKIILGYIPISVALNISLNYILYHILGPIGIAFSTIVVSCFIFIYFCSMSLYYMNKNRKVVQTEL